MQAACPTRRMFHVMLTQVRAKWLSRSNVLRRRQAVTELIALHTQFLSMGNMLTDEQRKRAATASPGTRPRMSVAPAAVGPAVVQVRKSLTYTL